MLLKGSVAILTGAGKKNGVGAATAKLLAKEGCHVLITCRSSEKEAREVIADCEKEGVEADIFVGDVTTSSECHRMADQVKEKWGRADILVNCVGITKKAPYEELDKLNEDDFREIFAVNSTAPYLLCQAFQSLLRASGDGAVVNVSSVSGITGKGSSIAYSASKGALNTLTLSLAQALSPEVRVNAVCPNFINSSWWKDAYKGKEKEFDALISARKEGNLLKDILTPSDVAQTILSIIQNRVMTGELIRLDCGSHVGKANPRTDQ